MLFRKRIEKSCSYCKFGTKLDEEEVLCSRKGLVSIDGKCRRFRYEPLKRIPKKPKVQNFSKFEDDDFSL